MKLLGIAWITALLMALALPCALAGGTAAIDEAGVVHTVAVEPWTSGNNTGGTVLVHITQAPDGAESRQFIPGTDNFTIELDPVIEIDPVRDAPVVAWSQVENRASSLYVARLEGGVWTEPHLVWDDGSVNLSPDIDIRQDLLHIVWRQERQQSETMRLSLDRESLAPVYGPEYLPMDQAGIGAPGDSAGPADTPDPALSYFASVVLPQVQEEPGRIITWGIRDEPVPVVYFQPFQLPLGIQSVRESDSQWLAGRFVTWFTSGPSFYYTTLDDGRWDELRLIDLSQGRSTAEALLLLQDLIRR